MTLSPPSSPCHPCTLSALPVAHNYPTSPHLHRADPALILSPSHPFPSSVPTPHRLPHPSHPSHSPRPRSLIPSVCVYLSLSVAN